jgi:tetratricopeptide (TPR) repeat protein
VPPYFYGYNNQPSFYPVNPPLPERETEPQPLAGNANLAPFGNQPNVEKPEPSDRATNRQSVALAWKFIGYGDKNFALKKFPDAVDRYRKAVEAAPQLADAYFRLGFAQTALGRYESAAKSMRRGLELDPKWPQSGFKLDALFAGNDEIKNARIEALVKASEKSAIDGDLAFLAGIHLYFDNQQDRAAPFFQLARQIYPDAEPINAFLRAQEKEE